MWAESYYFGFSSLDSATISLANNKNNKLTQALARTLATSENDKKLRSGNQLQGLLMQLEGCENPAIGASISLCRL